jgi:hypothetical protein
MATNIQQITIGESLKQTGLGVPTHLATKGSEFTDISTGLLYINKDGLNGWYPIIDGTISGGTSSLTGYTTTILFDSHTGDTSNPHDTTMSNLVSSAHTHTLNEITDFNTYSGVTDDKINTKISTSDAQANYVNVSGDSMTGVLLFPATTTTQESLRIQSGGTFLTTTKVGAFEFVGNALYFTDSSDTRRNVLLGSSGSTATTLDSLSDTNVGGASDGNSFYYDATSGFWRNTNIISINDDTNTVTINNNLFGNSISGNTIYSGSTNLIDIFLSQTNFNTYSASTNTVITNNKNAFDSHSANTSNPHNTTLSNLVSSAHTHPISQVIDLQTNLNNKFDKTGGTVNGNVVITGNVDILGTATTIHTSTLSVKDNIITLNSSQTGTTAPTVVDSGIDILRNSATTASLLWEEDNDYWAAGLSGSTSKIILQGDGLSLLNSGHTHPISEITNLQTSLDAKALDSSFDGHTGDTTIHYTKSSINLSDLGSSAHTHPISQVIDLQSTLDTKALDSSFDSHTGNTSNPHGTTLSNLVSSAHTHPISQVVDLQTSLDAKLTTSIFNTYSGSVNTQLNTKVEDADNIGSGSGQIYSGKSGTTLVLRTISGGSNTTVTTVGDVIKIDSTGGVSGDNFYVTGGTLLSQTLTLNRNDGNSVPIGLSGLVSGKTNTTLFDSHTGDTSNPHGTTLSNLTSSAHTHPISQVINLQSSLDAKALDSSLDSHTGDTTIHFTKGSINLSDLGSSAHTHTLSEITDFNGYSGNVQTQLDTKIENGINSGGANEVFSAKSGTDLYFRTISGGSNTTITTVGDIIKIDSTGGGGDNFYVTGFTYNDANTLTISRNGGLIDLTSTINTMTGLTVNGVLSASTYTGITLDAIDDVTTGIPTTPDNSYQGRQLYFDVVSNEFISSQEYGSTGTVTIWGKKGSAGTIDKGLPVYIVGFDDDIHEVELANATTATTMPVIGFTGEDFDNTTTNPIITFGRITGLNTTSTVSTLNPNGETWVVNDVLYMNTTDGGLTKNRPTGSNTQIQRIAKILKVDATAGQLFIFNTARTAGLPNLTTDYVWLGNGNDTPQEVIKTDLGVSVTGFSYNNNNTFTITDDNSGSYTATINQVSGLTVNGTLTLNSVGGTTSVTNLGVDASGNIVSGDTGGDTYSINVTQDGDNVDLTLDAASGSDSVVQLTAGSNITLTRNSANEVTIASSGGGGSGVSDANKIFSWYMNVT